MQTREFDVVVIGSGSGGGVVAAELSSLCRDGARVAVLEWGPKLKRGSFTGRELEMGGRLYVNSGGYFTRDGSMTLALCRAYGGSTVVYTGTSFVMRPETVEKWGVPGLDWPDINARSQKYFAANGVRPTPDELVNDNNALFKKGCEALGLPVEKFPVNIKDCRGAGVCNLGCPHGAKQGTDVVQLPAAERNGAVSVTCCKVERIMDRELLATVTEAPEYAEPSAWPPGEYRIRAKVVVVCGGTLNTCALLERSGFGDRLPMLGRRVTLHPALILAAVHEKRITNYQGHPKSYCCEHFSKKGRFILETCFYFPLTTAKSCIGFGTEHEELMSDMRRLQQILVLAWDSPKSGNRVIADRDGEPVLDYKISEDVLDALHMGMVWSTRIFLAAGAGKVHAPAGKKFFIQRGEEGLVESLIPRKNMLPGRLSLTSAHIMGGCGMGASAADSVTDRWGRVHGVPWLFVADSSLFPSCSEVNPYITIMALADGVAEGIKKDFRGLTNA